MSGIRQTIAQLRTAFGQFTGGRLLNETHQNFFETMAEGQEYGPSLLQRDRFEYFDDFTMEAIQTTGAGNGLWIVFAGSDGDATAAAIIAGVPEGAINMGSGDGGSTEDGSVLSLILLSKGSLISLGKTVLEVRVSTSVITGNVISIGLADKLATTAEHPMYTVIAGDIADGGMTFSNAAGFVYDTEATTTAEWHGVTENAGTIANVAASASAALGDGPTVNTYQVLRLEIDADGTARFYIDGNLAKTVTSAVATTSLLIPYIGIDAEAGTAVLNDLTVDYIYFSGARPSSNA